MAEEEEDASAAAAGGRTFWSGTITFGLVSVPVALLAANRPRSVSLRMVDREGAPLQRRYICSKDGKELDDDDIVRGYEIEKGTFVVVTDEELEAIEPRKSRDIELQRFVDAASIDPVYFHRAYYLVPAGGSNKAYRLLAEVMETSGRAGIATFVMRAREYVVAILAEKGILRAETLRFAREVRTPKEIGLPEKKKPAAAAVKKFETSIASRSRKVDRREFTDRTAERLKAIARKKAKRGVGVIRAPLEPGGGKGGEVVDLLEVLSRSLKGGRATARRGAAKVPSS
ncbi:MAG TPA: Ku protein [Thermoanaerobaculia bacterium]|nr:Ku protein [Thermoanaerobaculia bacterium]